jgi:hypothetical protein
MRFDVATFVFGVNVMSLHTMSLGSCGGNGLHNYVTWILRGEWPTQLCHLDPAGGMDVKHQPALLHIDSSKLPEQMLAT